MRLLFVLALNVAIAFASQAEEKENRQNLIYHSNSLLEEVLASGKSLDADVTAEKVELDFTGAKRRDRRSYDDDQGWPGPVDNDFETLD